MKNKHSKQITELLYSDRSGDNIDVYINSQLNKNNKWWIATIIISIIMTFAFTRTNKPTRQEILHCARPVIDSMHEAYQNRMDIITDSLSNLIPEHKK